MNSTLDSIVKRALGASGLSLHYYVPYLIQAKRCLQFDLGFDLLPAVKTVQIMKEGTEPVDYTGIVISSDGTFSLPEDCIEELSIYQYSGDRKIPFAKDNALNESGSDGYEKVREWNGDVFIGRTHERGTEWSRSYTKDLASGKIRISASFLPAFDDSETLVKISYVTQPSKVNAKSVAHPYFENALIEYMIWQFARVNPTNRFDPQIKRREYYNELRKARARKKALRKEDFIRVLRKAAN